MSCLTWVTIGRPMGGATGVEDMSIICSLVVERVTERVLWIFLSDISGVCGCGFSDAASWVCGLGDTCSLSYSVSGQTETLSRPLPSSRLEAALIM